MTEPDAHDDLLIAEVMVQRVIRDGQDVISVTAQDSSGDDLALVEALGLLRFAEDSVIRERMGGADDD